MFAPRILRAWLVVGSAALALAGCGGPTYPKARLVPALQELFASEQLTTTVRVIDHTLAVQIEQAGALAQVGGQVSVGPAFDETSRKLLTVIHRVVLSSDAQIRFYVLLLSDPKVPGAYVTIVRYMDDVERFNVNKFDTMELFARTIFEMNYVGPQPVTLEQYVPRDIRMEEFLSWQLARRIQHRLMEALRPSGAADVGRCGGEFRNGEFVFTLNVTLPAGGTANDEVMRNVFKASTSVVSQVLSGYHFNSFNQVRLIHPATGRTLVLPKARLDLLH